MPFTVKKIKGIDTSSLDKLGSSVVDLAKYTEDEFSQVASALQGTDPEHIWNVQPPKPRRGTIVYADGTHWNPGNGEGPYWFDGTAFHPMGLMPSGGGPWTSATILGVAPAAGAFANASGSGRFQQIGKTVYITIFINIISNGTASSAIIVGLPVTSANLGFPYVLSGRENAVAGKMLQGLINPNSSAMTVLNYDNSYPGGNGFALYLSGIYECA